MWTFISAKANQEINQFLDDYYDRYTGIYLKSKKLLQNVSRIMPKENI